MPSLVRVSARLPIVYIALAAALLVAIACGDSGEAKPTVTSPAASPTISGQTGISELDRVIEALATGDPNLAQPLIRFMKVPCVDLRRAPAGAGEACGPGEQVGQLVEVFPEYACECVPCLNRPGLVASRLNGSAAIHSAYRAPPNSPGGGDYVVLLTTAHPELGLMAMGVVIDGGQIVATYVDCGLSPQEMIQELGLTDAVLAPEP